MAKKKYRLRPWVKVAMAFIVGVAIVSQISKAMDGQAEEKEIIMNESIHGIVETASETHAYLTAVEKDLGVGDVVVPNDYYSNGDVITVSYDGHGNIKNSRRATAEEVEALKESHGTMYRILMEKHGETFE